jgi:predicted pyridoxine 5'-phosphate oxidase superfamily flavin-nucleotide-binding protein
MGLISADMKRVVEEQRLGFVATVCPDGTPNLSPKGTTVVWDADHLVFANIRSPGTLANLRQNPSVEVNVVDPFVRKGYRFKGVASILDSGPQYDEVIAFYKERGVANTIREVVMVRVHSAADRLACLRSRPHRRRGARAVGAPLAISACWEHFIANRRVTSSRACRPTRSCT